MAILLVAFLAGLSARGSGAGSRALFVHWDEDVLEVEAQVKQVKIDTLGTGSGGRALVRLSLPRATPDESTPGLPRWLLWVAVPPGSVPRLEKVILAPSRTLVTRVRLIEPPSFVSKKEAERKTARVRNPGVSLGKPVKYRGFRLCPLSIQPFFYDSVSGELRVVSTVRLALRFEEKNGQGGVPQNDGRELAPLWLRELVVNPMHLIAAPVSVPPGKTTARRFQGAHWFRLEARRSGLVAVPWELLVSAGADSTTLAMGRIALFSGNGKPLPQYLSEPEPDLVQIPYTVFGGEPGAPFGPGKSLVYVALGPDGWEWHSSENRFEHWVNPYADRNVTWLVVGGPQGRRMNVQRLVLPGGARPKTLAPVLFHFEEDRELPDDSGTEWVWRYLTRSMVGNFDFQMPNVAAVDSARLRFRLVGLSDTHHTVAISVNGQRVGRVTLAFRRAQEFEIQLPPALVADRNRLRLYASENGSIVALDWFEVEAGCKLVVDSLLELQGPPARGWIALRGTVPESLVIVDVSRPGEPELVEPARDDSGRALVSVEQSERLLIAKCSAVQLPQAVIPTRTDPRLGQLRDGNNQADYIALGPKDALQQASLRRLLDFHRQAGRAVQAVALEDVYDQFSWGLTDPTAMRNFLRYTFRHWQKAPRWVLLIGDATYDLRNVLGLNGQWVCPSHESGGSVSDDWFVEWTEDRIPDAAIGRLPAKNPQELDALVDKILTWQQQAPVGLWRATLTFAADDPFRKREYFPEDEVFERDTENMVAAPVLRDFDVRKIYLERYRWDAVGNRPGARSAFLAQLNEGTVFVNYLGHANWNQIAHETLFQSPDDFEQLDNGNRLPIAFAGTCETARVDDPHFDSVAELALRCTGGGFASWIGCARWTMHGVSVALDERFIDFLFRQGNRGRVFLGDALLAAKIGAGFPDQTEAVFLLGDPCSVVPLPRNQVALQVSPDTLDAHHRVWVHLRPAGNDSFHVASGGLVAVRLYDAARQVSMAIGEVSFPGPLLFEGVLPVNEKEPTVSFFVARDTLGGGPSGRLVALTWNRQGGQVSGVGAADSLFVLPDTVLRASERDTIAPELSLSVTRGLVEEVTPGYFRVQGDFELSVSVRDSGSSRAAVRVWVEDPVTGQPQELLAQSPPEPGGGWTTVRWKVCDWSEGLYSFRVCAEDAAGNRRCLEISVEVLPEVLELAEVLPFPNPATQQVQFLVGVNQDVAADVAVYTVAGRCIWRWHGIVSAGQNLLPFEPWALKDADGDALANGAYLFRIRVRSLWNRGQSCEQVGKFVVAR